MFTVHGVWKGLLGKGRTEKAAGRVFTGPWKVLLRWGRQSVSW